MLKQIEKSKSKEWKMLRNLKLLIIVLIILFLSSSLSFPLDQGKATSDKVQEEQVLTGKSVVIPKDTTGAPQTYQIPWSVLNGGGTDMASTGYKAMVSTAQPVIGASQSTNYQLKIGYWYGGKPFVCGDVNETGNVDIADIVYLVSYLFKHGPEPDPLYCANANGDSSVTIADIVYLVAFIFKHGPMPNCQ
jgi:hypothetical protein